MDLSTIIATSSLLLSVVSLVWIGGFRFASLIHEVKALRETIHGVENQVDSLERRMEARFEKVEAKIDNLNLELHKIDIRVSILEKESRDRR